MGLREIDLSDYHRLKYFDWLKFRVEFNSKFQMNLIYNDNKFCTKPNNQVIYGKLNHTETINLKKT